MELQRNMRQDVRVGQEVPVSFVRRNTRPNHMHSLAYHRPVRNGYVPPRPSSQSRETWEPPIWIAVPVLAVLGYAFLVLMLSL